MANSARTWFWLEEQKTTDNTHDHTHVSGGARQPAAAGIVGDHDGGWLGVKAGNNNAGRNNGRLSWWESGSRSSRQKDVGDRVRGRGLRVGRIPRCTRSRGCHLDLTIGIFRHRYQVRQWRGKLKFGTESRVSLDLAYIGNVNFST